MKTLSKLQIWTTPIWLILMIGPVAYLIYHQPNTVFQFVLFQGNNHYQFIDISAIMLGAGVCLA